MSAVRRRGIFFVGGYDPKSPQAFFRIFSREIRRFEALWNVASDVTVVEAPPSAEVGTALVRTHAADWSVESEFNFLVFEGLVLRDFDLPLWFRLGKYLRAFGDLVLSGALFRYFALNWRFGLYTLFPFFMLLCFAAAGIGAGALIRALDLPFAAVAAPVGACLVFAICLHFLGRRWPILHLMDLWSFSIDYLRGRRPDAEQLFGRWSDFVIARTQSGHFEEVILIGHSTGGAVILDVGAKCLERDPEFAHRSRVTMMTLGSTALKVGLHPAALDFRNGVQRLADCGALRWVDVQSLTDVINFPRSNVVRAMKLRPPASPDFLLRRSVSMRNMLQRSTWRRIMWNVFRVHYQYVYGNTSKFFYDFFMICCGPIDLQTRMARRIVGAGIDEEAAP
jgi:hypothetical protein